MNRFTRWTGVLGMSGLFVLGGLSAAQALQQQDPPQLDVNRLVDEFGLDKDAKAEITPELEKLNELLAERAREWEKHDAIRSGMADVFSSLLPRLSAEQRQSLWSAIRGVQGMGDQGRHMGSRMGQMMGSGMQFGQGRHCRRDGTPMGGAARMGDPAGGMGPMGMSLPAAPDQGAVDGS